MQSPPAHMPAHLALIRSQSLPASGAAPVFEIQDLSRRYGRRWAWPGSASGTGQLGGWMMLLAGGVATLLFAAWLLWERYRIALDARRDEVALPELGAEAPVGTPDLRGALS